MMGRVLLMCLSLWLVLIALPAAAASAWAPALEARLAGLEEEYDAELGVHLRDLEGDERFGWRDRESWYLASLVKLPVAVELLARVEAGAASLDETLMLQARHYVDGAGPTNWAPPGERLSLGELMEAMLTVSDNTATDMLIERLGLEAVNRRARRLAGEGGMGPITPLVEVRREVYGRLHPAARKLGGLDFIELSKLKSDAERLAWLRERLGVTRTGLEGSSLEAAYADYYAGELNSGRLEAVAELLVAIGSGRALGPTATHRLLSTLARTSSGESRLKAGFGPDVDFAHKTGTQRRLACDAGLIISAQGHPPRQVVVACVRGPASLASRERALAAVGRALRDVGALSLPDN